jgi:electron transfer flavoprotein beta subunit
VTPATFQPVVNGFDENALEAALRLKDSQGATITVLSVGGQFSLDIMKKALAMGADALILCQDPLFANLPDSFVTAQVLCAAIRKIGAFDLILCGRQASDWDNAQVPLMLAELLDVPQLTFAKQVEVEGDRVIVHRQTEDGYQVVEGPSPCLVTVTAGIAEPRYASLKGIMAARSKEVKMLSLADLGVEKGEPAESVESVEDAAAREAGEIVEDDGTVGVEKIMAVLQAAKVI